MPKRNRLLLLGLLALGTLLTVAIVDQFSKSPLYQDLSQVAFLVGEAYERWFKQQSLQNPLILIALSFAGGLVASISPCILSLLPVNLSYIGTREITSRRDALAKAGAFVLGVVTVLSLLGLFSSVAAIVLIQFRGYFHLAVGLIIVLMGLSLAGLLQISLPSKFLGKAIAPPQFPWQGKLPPLITGPYSVGLTFALVSSPCTSPVMIAVLSAAAATQSHLQSTLAMVSYAIGYTAIIFLASLFTGLAKQTHALLVHSTLVMRIASGVLLLVGGFYLVNGAQWVIALWTVQ